MTPKHSAFRLLLLTMFLAVMACSDETGRPSTTAHPTVDWVLACRVGNGGFGCYPGDSAFTSRTGMALEALEKLGAREDLAHRDSLIAWLQARQQPDGGFIEADDYYLGKKLPWGSISALEPTYWAVRALSLLGAQPVDPEAAAEFILARRHENGGYDAWEYCWGAAKEGLFSTYWAVAALRELGRPVPDSLLTLEWVRSMQDTDARRGGFSLANDDWFYGSPAGCYYALRTLELLGGTPKRPEHVKKFLLSDYGQEPDGGFEVGHAQGWRQDHFSRTEDTWYSVKSLALLGMPLADKDRSRAPLPRTDCIRWLGSMQNPDGGFARFGKNPNVPLPGPSEMRPTWHAVMALEALEADIPRPVAPIRPAVETESHLPEYTHPCLDSRDPAEVRAYRRIALPIYEHYYKLTGSRLKALGMVNRWAAAAVGPHNGAWIVNGRGILMHGWGQCGTMSWLFQSLATSIDFPARPSFIIADVNLEILVQEEGWDKPHWCLFVPFTNEFPSPAIQTPEGTYNGWSVLDMAVNYSRMAQDSTVLQPTDNIANRLFKDVRVERIDPATGRWAGEIKMDSTTAYGSPAADSLYPGGSW